ncbi:retinol-binding protein pinta isoform X1 [Bombyx mori]|uniref:CRAL-TRIO domain-containing protein n=1 Tax=Bombyx mori TaxID=7091 RepID=A0A8R2QRZ3_BOMMO|nr:retinol-binding protein pinta isoform X1 [Bombyx mori]
MEIRPLSDALRKRAREEINENPETLVSNFNELREWLNEHPQLKSEIISDQWLVAFLRGSKHNLEKCKSKIERYYNLSTAAPELYANRDPLDPQIQELLKLGLFLPLKKCASEDSPRIVLVRMGELNKVHGRLSDLCKIGFMIAEILLLEDDNFTISGEELVSDLKDTGFGLIRQWTPAYARKLFMCFENALTIRMTRINVLNAPIGMRTAVAIFKLFLKEKLKKRIYIYNEDYEEMFKYIPKSLLPKEYGGTEGTLQDLTDHWKNKVESYRSWYLRENLKD